MKCSYQLLVVAATVAMTAACTEKPQTIGSQRIADEVPYAGTKYPYAAPGWTAGDERGWKDQLRVRAQFGQNDYSRM